MPVPPRDWETADRDGTTIARSSQLNTLRNTHPALPAQTCTFTMSILAELLAFSGTTWTTWC